jgi:IS30 family transposase
MAMHFTALEREQLSTWLQMKVSKAEIARRLDRHPSTIFRELRRNSVRRCYGHRPTYRAIAAQQLSDQRKHQRRKRKLERPEIRRYVERHLQECWSPDQIAGRMRHDFPDQSHLRVSHQAIYQWLDRHDHARRFRPCLRRFRVRIKMSCSRPAAATIANRPPIIERRERIGDWEGDTIVGARRSGGVVSLVERKTGYTILAKVDRLCSVPVEKVIRRRLRSLPKSCRHSITFDNGGEFAQYPRLAKALSLEVYFAQPHSPWQRGTNENTNGLVRQFLPKGSCFRDLNHTAVARIQSSLNERPRKRLGYLTPKEALVNASHAILS